MTSETRQALHDAKLRVRKALLLAAGVAVLQVVVANDYGLAFWHLLLRCVIGALVTYVVSYYVLIPEILKAKVTRHIGVRGLFCLGGGIGAIIALVVYR